VSTDTTTTARKPELMSEDEWQCRLLLARAYRSMSRESWQDGETIEEVRSAVNDFMFNLHGVDWDNRYPRKNGPVEV
jgi:hypothetical protein